MPETEAPPEGTEGAPPEGTEGTQETQPPADLGDAGKQAIDRMKSERNDARKEAKALQAKLEEIQRSSMTDQEKAIDEAKATARADALAEVGSKIAAAEFKAAAAGRLDDAQMTTLLSGLDLKAFLDDSGDVDPAKVKTFVDTVAPAVEETEPPPGDLLAGLDLGQGSRGTPGLGSTQLERDLRRTLGIS